MKKMLLLDTPLIPVQFSYLLYLSKEAVIQNVQGMRDENINISDVIEVIETDPDFKESSKMFNGGGEVNQQRQNPSLQDIRRQAYVRIVEQPASKALRFRYECEGRSAGSIPGATSTPENKTFPSIQVMGYTGRAVVVVSCVTKDPPFKPHPHNLVGREGCKKGVCTLEISTETMSVTFSNLGIQCIKKKDIESALRLREEVRVDPFRTGFSHRNQPTSIDLNAVRLCFQVFLESERGKFNLPLTPVVSEPIYDKKAMCDLSIVKLSDCVSYVDGGRKDIILLCEKVAKEDIQIRFFEEKDGQLVWEDFGDFQPSQVHKQTAIWFRTPRYRTLEVTEPVKVFIQLRRPSDGVSSEPLPFELLPLDSGRPPYWSFRRNISKKGNYNLFNSILANDSKLLAKRQLGHLKLDNKNKVNIAQSEPEKLVVLSAPAEQVLMETNNNEPSVQDKQMETCWDTYSEIKKPKSNDLNIIIDEQDKSLNDLIDQVAELDEIYSDTKARLLNEQLNDIANPQLNQLSHNESFDDARTYSSLQLAFKNPIAVENSNEKIINSKSPAIDLATTTKRENDTEKLPPLPPKRAKKIETYIGGSMQSIQLTGKQAENILHGSNPSLRAVSVSRSASFNLNRPKSHGELSAPGKRLPPTPSSTLPNPKKRGFFSKLFTRKSKTPGTSRETSLQPSQSLERNSFSSSKSLQPHTNLARSSSNISTHSAASVRIPLKDSPPGSATNVESPGENITNVIIANDNNNLIIDSPGEDIGMNLDLTEAENYALYMAMAPHATQSEFDEMSCYYAPVEGGKILTADATLKSVTSKT